MYRNHIVMEDIMTSYKILAGPNGEYDIIQTDAPMEFVEQQMNVNNDLIHRGVPIEDLYSLLRGQGHQVEVMANHIDFENFDDEFDEDDLSFDEE